MIKALVKRTKHVQRFYGNAAKRRNDWETFKNELFVLFNEARTLEAEGGTDFVLPPVNQMSTCNPEILYSSLMKIQPTKVVKIFQKWILDSERLDSEDENDEIPIEVIAHSLVEKFLHTKSGYLERHMEKMCFGKLPSFDGQFFDLCGMSLPQHIVSVILQFVKRDVRILRGNVGVVNSDWRLIVLSTWTRVTVSRRSIFRIPLVVLQNIRHLQFHGTLWKSQLQYLFSHITARLIHTFSILSDSMDEIYQILSYLVSTSTSFPSCHTLSLLSHSSQLFPSLHPSDPPSETISKLFPNLQSFHLPPQIQSPTLNTSLRFRSTLERENADAFLISLYDQYKTFFLDVGTLPKLEAIHYSGCSVPTSGPLHPKNVLKIDLKKVKILSSRLHCEDRHRRFSSKKKKEIMFWDDFTNLQELQLVISASESEFRVNISGLKVLGRLSLTLDPKFTRLIKSFQIQVDEAAYMYVLRDISIHNVPDTDVSLSWVCKELLRLTEKRLGRPRLRTVELSCEGQQGRVKGNKEVTERIARCVFWAAERFAMRVYVKNFNIDVFRYFEAKFRKSTGCLELYFSRRLLELSPTILKAALREAEKGSASLGSKKGSKGSKDGFCFDDDTYLHFDAHAYFLSGSVSGIGWLLQCIGSGSWTNWGLEKLRIVFCSPDVVSLYPLIDLATFHEIRGVEEEEEEEEEDEGEDENKEKKKEELDFMSDTFAFDDFGGGKEGQDGTGEGQVRTSSTFEPTFENIMPMFYKVEEEEKEEESPFDFEDENEKKKFDFRRAGSSFEDENEKKKKGKKKFSEEDDGDMVKNASDRKELMERLHGTDHVAVERMKSNIGSVFKTFKLAQAEENGLQVEELVFEERVDVLITKTTPIIF